MTTGAIEKLITACETLEGAISGVLRDEGIEDKAAIEAARAELDALVQQHEQYQQQIAAMLEALRGVVEWGPRVAGIDRQEGGWALTGWDEAISNVRDAITANDKNCDVDFVKVWQRRA